MWQIYASELRSKGNGSKSSGFGDRQRVALALLHPLIPSAAGCRAKPNFSPLIARTYRDDGGASPRVLRRGGPTSAFGHLGGKAANLQKAGSAEVEGELRCRVSAGHGRGFVIAEAVTALSLPTIPITAHAKGQGVGATIGLGILGGAIAGATVASPAPGPTPIPLSTAESCVFALENYHAGLGNLIAISLLSPFWPCRPTAEIGRLFRRLAADRQRNSAACLSPAEFGISEMLT